MVEITELNREPASTVSTLTASTEVTSPSVTTDALEADDGSFNDSFSDPSGTKHTTELAETSDLHAEDHASRHNDGGPDELQVDNLAADNGSDGQFLQSDGSSSQWANVNIPEQKISAGTDSSTFNFISTGQIDTAEDTPFTIIDTNGEGFFGDSHNSDASDGINVRYNCEITIDGVTKSFNGISTLPPVYYNSSLKVVVTGANFDPIISISAWSVQK